MLTTFEEHRAARLDTAQLVSRQYTEENARLRRELRRTSSKLEDALNLHPTKSGVHFERSDADSERQVEAVYHSKAKKAEWG